MLEASMATVGERILAEPKESCSEVTGLSMTMQKSGSRIKIWVSIATFLGFKYDLTVVCGTESR